MKKLISIFCFFIVLKLQAQPPNFQQIHNAQAIDWIKGVKYLGIPYGTTPSLNGTVTSDPGSLYFNTLDSSVYAYTGTQYLKITGSGAVGDGNNYPVSISFSGGTLTLVRNGLSSISTTGFDIRYLRFTDTTSLIPTKAFLSNNHYTKTQEDARFVPLTRTLTINNVTKTLAQNDSFTVTTSEVDPKRVTGVEWSGNDSVHILTVTLADGTQFNKPFFDRSGNGGSGGGSTFDSTYIYAALADSASVLRDSLNAIRNSGYLLAETDPIFTASDAFPITSTDISNWNSAFSWGNHAGLYVQLSDSSSMLSPYLRGVGYALSKSGQIVSFDSLSTAVGFHTRPYNDLRYYPFSSNPAGYLTTVDAATSVTDSTFDLSLSSGLLKLFPYSAKKGSDPGYAYFYNGSSNPTFTSRINLDGQLYLQSLSASSVIQTNNGAQMVGNVFNSNGSSNNLTMYVNNGTLAQISFQTNSDVPTRLVIGDNNGGVGNNTNLDIDDVNKKIAFNADSIFMRVKNGVSGTADSALIRDVTTGRIVMKKINTGTGTVSDFSAGDLSPLFTTSEATTTTTPALTFNLSNAAAYTVFGRGSGSGAPSYLSSIDSNWIPALHSQTYYDLRYLQSANVNNGDTIIGGYLGHGGSLIRNTTTAGNNKTLEYTDLGYFHITSANNTGLTPNERGHFEFSDVDIFAYMQPGDGSQGSSLWLDYNGVGRNIWQLRSWYDAGGDESTVQGRSTDGGSHDGYIMLKQTAGNFRYKTPVSLSSSDKLASFDIAGANGFGAKMGYTNVLAPLLLSGGNLYADTSAGSSHLATQYFVTTNSDLKASPTYIIAASNSPAVLKARADYICDGTADEVEIKAALLLGNVTLEEGTFTITSGILIPSNRTLSGTGKGTILLASGMGTGFSGTADSSTVMVGNSGSEGITVRDLTIDGNVNTKWAILFTSVGSYSGDTAVAGVRVQNVYIKNIGSSGIELRNCWNNLIHGNIMNKVYQDGITLTRTTGANRTTRTVISNNIINGGFAAFFSTYADTTILSGNTFDGQIDETVQIENSTEISMINNIISNGDDYNVYFNTCTGINMQGNTITKNNGAGEIVAFFSCSQILVSNNKISNSTRDGIRLDDCQNAIVSGNNISDNSSSSNDTYSGIYLSGSDDVSLIGNIIKKGTLNTNKQKYGINITSGSDRTLVQGNNLYLSGVTSDILTANATTRQRSNTANDGTWKDLLYTAAQYEMNTSRILGRTTASQGKAEEISISDNLSLSGGVLKFDSSTSATGYHTQPYNDLRYYSISNPSGFITNGTETDPLSIHLNGTSTIGSSAVIATGSNTLTISTSTSGGSPLQITSTTGVGTSINTTTGLGLQVNTTTGTPGLYAMLPATTNTIESILQVRRGSSGTVTSGIGGAIDFYLHTDGGGYSISNRIISKLTDVATSARTSQIDFIGYSAGSQQTFANFQTGGIVRVNNLADTLATKAYARSVGGGGGGGSGTVTDFSAGDLSPLFTTSEATTTTTPALTFSLTNAAAHTFFGNNTGSTGAPAYVAITSADLPDLSSSYVSVTTRKAAFQTSVGTDANITAAAGFAYRLPPATLTASRTIDMTNVNANGDYVEFYNNEEGFTWSFTGQTVYDSDGVTAITELLANANSVVRRIDGKLMISKL